AKPMKVKARNGRMIEPLVQNPEKPQWHFPAASAGDFLKELHIEGFNESVLKAFPHYVGPGEGAELLFVSPGRDAFPVELISGTDLHVSDQVKGLGLVFLLAVIPPGILEFEGRTSNSVNRLLDPLVSTPIRLPTNGSTELITAEVNLR